MKTITLISTLLLAASHALAAPAENRFFELRTYHAAPGKLDALQARFRDHTLKLFQRHGIENIGYWVPANNTGNQLVFLLAYPSREAREASWKAFMADPDWQAAYKASEKDGPLVTKADSVFLKATDYSPAVKVGRADTERLFELRTYKAAPGKLDALQARFRDHTLGLFTKHGITHVGYWVPTEAKDGAGDTLIYILAHKDQQAMEASFKSFRTDPAWVAAKAASETGGPLTVPDGVKSLPMKPTDFSPLK